MTSIKKLVLSVVALAVLAVAGFLVWFFVIKDDPKPRLTTSDLDKALSTEVVDATTLDGTWTIDQSSSTAGYRVKEVLAGLDTEGVGRTSQVTGTLTIADTAATAGQFSVDMASITSDESRRDGQFRGRIMNVAEFPTATFTLTAPIDFGAVPSEGQTVKATATGDLTLHGVTKAVSFGVDAKLQGGKIGVLGNIKVVFADYSIPNPSNAFAKTGEDGLLEFVLVFVRS